RVPDGTALRGGVGLPLRVEGSVGTAAAVFPAGGGMDRIAYAFYERVRPVVRLTSPITAIRRRDAGVRIQYGPGQQALDADYCICTLPLPLLNRVATDFSAAKQTAIRDNSAYLASTKVGFESPRFWEAEGIYGGLAWTDRANENIFYPSHGWLEDKGVLVTAYSSGWTGQNHPTEFAAMSHAERFRVCAASVEALHPGKSHLLGRPVTVSWPLTRWSEGVGPMGPAF